MGMEQKTKFSVDKSKCIKCGNCINTCPGTLMFALVPEHMTGKIVNES